MSEEEVELSGRNDKEDASNGHTGPAFPMPRAGWCWDTAMSCSPTFTGRCGNSTCAPCCLRSVEANRAGNYVLTGHERPRIPPNKVIHRGYSSIDTGHTHTMKQEVETCKKFCSTLYSKS